MPWQRELYPDNWEQIAEEIKDAARWCCQGCGVQCYRPGEVVKDRRRLLTVHHKDRNPANCAKDNLIALCTRCHLKAEHKLLAAERRAAQVCAGQMVLGGGSLWSNK